MGAPRRRRAFRQRKGEFFWRANEDEDDTTVRDFLLDGAVLDDFRHVRKLVVDAVDVGERKEVCADGQELKKRRDGPGERLKTERHGPPPGRPLSLRRRRRRSRYT